MLAVLYDALQTKYGKERADTVMVKVLSQVACGFFKGFTPIGPGEKLPAFSKVYQAFENNNLVFEVIEDSEEKLEFVVRRCLINESMNELGMGHLAPHICDFAFEYFKSYHPNIEYLKDRAIGKGDETCHEIFLWKE